MRARDAKGLETTAFHEAGHAVVAMLSGLRIERVTVQPGADYLGAVDHLPWPDDFSPDVEIDAELQALMFEHISCSLAGALAEKRFRGRANHLGAAFDRSCAAELAMRLCGSSRQVDALIRWRGIVAEDCLEANWRKVETVARALLAEKTLDGAAVRELVFPPISRRAG